MKSSAFPNNPILSMIMSAVILIALSPQENPYTSLKDLKLSISS